MDIHGQVGPDLTPNPNIGSYVEDDAATTYQLDAEHIAYCLRDGATVRVKHAYRGSVYELVFIPTGHAGFVNYTGPNDWLDHEQRVYIGNVQVYRNGGFYPFSWDTYAAPNYVSEKLGISNDVDAVAIAKFITKVLGGDR